MGAPRTHRRDAGNDPTELGALRLVDLDQQLEHEPRHTVNSGIAARDDDDRFPIHRFLERRAAAIDLLRHARVEDSLILDNILDQLHIALVPDDHRRLLNCAPRAVRHIVQTAGADAHNAYFSHKSATVTFPNTVLPSAMRPPLFPAAQSAAASETFPTPIVCLTKLDSFSPYCSTICASSSRA